MNTKIKRITYFALIALTVSLSTVAEAQTRAYRVSDRQVQTLLDRIESRTNTFRNEIDRTLDDSNIDGTNREDSINTRIANFETATDTLRNNFASRRSTASDVQEVLNTAVSVNRLMRNNRITPRAQSQWTQIRADLNTLAGYYDVTSNWIDPVIGTNSQGGYNVSDAQLRTLLDRLLIRSNSFRQSFSRWARNNNAMSDVSLSVTEFDTALRNLSRNHNNRRSGSSSLEQVLRPSAAINSFISSNQTSNNVSNRWELVRTDLTTLAGYYRMSWNWNDTVIPGGQIVSGIGSSFDSRLTGTYRLNAGLSDNVTTMVDRAIMNANYDVNQGDRMRRQLERRLTSPETLTLEKRGQEVTMSSANGSSIILNADGVARTETSARGRTVRTSVTATNRDLTINYEGDRMSDYYVTFMPINNGQLRVARRVYLENQSETITVTSVYDKTSQTPQWNTVTDPPYAGGNTVNRFLIPNNTGIVATLDAPLSTRTAKDGDRFSMTVTSPSQYRGAVIEGNVVGEKSGVVSGRANMSLSFDTIRVGSQSYRFAGIVDQVRQANGDVVSVNNEGAVRDGSQTTKTVTRAGIGAALGALIGAIAGGGKGAAIGAGVGAGAGAGTVILQGRDNLELATGSQFTITSTAPANTVEQ